METRNKIEEACDFGKRVQVCLAKLQANSADIAKRLGCSPGDVSKHVSGERKITPRMVGRYIEAFRDMGLIVPEQFFYVPWDYIHFWDPKRSDCQTDRQVAR